MPVPAPSIQPSQPDYGAAEQRLLPQVEKGQQAVTEAYQKTEPAVEQARQGLTQELQQPSPAAPKLQDIPQYQPRQGTAQDINLFAGLLTAFASLASLRTREPLTAALNAAGAGMEGLHKGQLDQAKLEMEQFDKQMASAMRENEKTLAQYKAIIDSKKYTLSQKQAMLAVATSARDDAVAHAINERDGPMGMMKLMASLQDGAGAAETTAITC